MLHLCCGTGRPLPMRMCRLFGGHDHYVIRVSAFESADGWTLIDSGFGTDDRRDLNPIKRAALGFDLSPGSLTVERLAAAGIKASDVRRIVLTHLDLDHAGGVRDFPQATVHVAGPEWRYATTHRHPRYIRAQFGHLAPVLHELDGGESWEGFAGVRSLDDTDNVLLVPLVGHSPGHMGVAVRDGAGRWLLHAGDLYMHRGEVDPAAPPMPGYMAAFQRAVAQDVSARRANVDRVRALVHRADRGVDVVCAHDPVEQPACC